MSHLNPFPKVLQKQAGRAKARLLQNLGKAERTTDEEFDLHVKNFNNQQNAGLRLHKEFKNYWQCLRAMQLARKNLLDTICELYEPCWDGVQDFLVKSEVSNKHFEDFVFQLNSDVLTPMNQYLSQFPEYSNKISKRNRKLLDFDNCRHNLQNLEATRKKDGKIVKAKEQLDDASHLFELINNELHDDLPALYKRRVSFFATNLQGLFERESAFHTGDALTLIEISGLLDKLMEAYERGEYDETPCIRFESPTEAVPNMPEPEYLLAKEGLLPESSPSNMQERRSEGNISLEESCSKFDTTVFPTPAAAVERSPGLDTHSEIQTAEVKTENVKSGNKADTEVKIETDTKNTLDIVPKTEAKSTSSSETIDTVEESTVEGGPAEESSAGESSAECELCVFPPVQFLYQVMGTYKYAAEDEDELSFDVGDIIYVIEYDDPEEQEEGWLMGVFAGRKGLFPANFTVRL